MKNIQVLFVIYIFMTIIICIHETLKILFGPVTFFACKIFQLCIRYNFFKSIFDKVRCVDFVSFHENIYHFLLYHR